VQIEIGNCDLEERCIHIFFYALTRLLSLSLSPSLIFSLSARFFLSSFVGTRDTRLRAHISNTRGDHFQQQPCSLRTRGIYRYREIFPSPNLVVNDSVYHFQQHTLYESFHPKDTRFCAHISNTSGDHFWQLQNKSLRSKDILFRVRISNTRGDHHRQLQNKYIHSKDTRFRARIANTRGDQNRQH